jgi:hypothetical protein
MGLGCAVCAWHARGSSGSVEVVAYRHAGVCTPTIRPAPAHDTREAARKLVSTACLASLLPRALRFHGSQLLHASQLLHRTPTGDFTSLRKPLAGKLGAGCCWMLVYSMCSCSWEHMLEWAAKKWRGSRGGAGGADASALAGAPGGGMMRGAFQLSKAGRRESAVPLRDDMSIASMGHMSTGGLHVSAALRH